MRRSPLPTSTRHKSYSALVKSRLPVLGFAAFSGTGKTTLLKQVIPLLKASGICLGVIKHAHHDFDIDHPGKDSYELRKAGAEQMLIASSKRWALMVETAGQAEADLNTLIDKLDPSQLDLILVEGFKHVTYPKIELHRHAMNKPFLYPDDSSIMAIALDEPGAANHPLPVLDINHPEQICAFILKQLLNKSA